MMKCINNNPIGTRLSLERHCPSITLDRIPSAESRTLRAHFVPVPSPFLLSVSTIPFICFLLLLFFLNPHLLFVCIFFIIPFLHFLLYFQHSFSAVSLVIVHANPRSVRDLMSRQFSTFHATFVTYNSSVGCRVCVFSLVPTT